MALQVSSGVIPYSSQDKEFAIRNLFSILMENKYKEDISQFEHMAQAANLAIKYDPKDYEMIVASFLHDIMHSSNPEDEYGNINHDKLAYDFLKGIGMTDRICFIILNHTRAKRYLVSTWNGYYEKLSEASKETLSRQGGVMTTLEIENFEKEYYFSDYIKFREFDDRAKHTYKEIQDSKGTNFEIDDVQDFEYYFQYVRMFF